MPKSVRISRDRIVNTYDKCLGNKKLTCKQLGITPPTLRSWIKDDPQLEQQLAEIDKGFYGASGRKNTIDKVVDSREGSDKETFLVNMKSTKEDFIRKALVKVGGSVEYYDNVAYYLAQVKLMCPLCTKVYEKGLRKLKRDYGEVSYDHIQELRNNQIIECTHYAYDEVYTVWQIVKSDFKVYKKMNQKYVSDMMLPKLSSIVDKRGDEASISDVLKIVDVLAGGADNDTIHIFGKPEDFATLKEVEDIFKTTINISAVYGDNRT